MTDRITSTCTRPAALLLSAALLLYPVAALAQPANDNCGTATNIASLPYSDATILASSCTTSTQDATCNSGASGWFDVWYTYTPGVNTTFSMSETSTIDTFQAIYTGSCGSLTQVFCTDPESASFVMCAGTTYYIQVGKWSSTAPTAGVNYNINFSAGAAPPAPPANDSCATATVIAPASLPYSNTVDARTDCDTDLDTTCNASGPTETRHGVWYSFTPTCTGAYTLAETSAADTIRAVFTASDPNSPCTTLTQVRCDDNESVTFNMTAGTTYYILCGMWSATASPTASYTVTLSAATSLGLTCNAASPANVQAGGSTVLTATVGPVCAAPATTSATVNVNLTNIGGAASVAMLDDGVPPDAVAGDWIYTVSATVAPATTLGAKTLAVSATDDQARVATPCNITVTVVPAPPANDECAGAIAIACGSSNTTDNTGATTAGSDPIFACRVGGDPNHAQGTRTTWYTFVPTGTSAVVDTEGSAVTDTLLHAFSGTCGSLTVIGCDDDGGTGLLSSITLTGLTAGTTYYIEAANWAPTTTPGNIKVNVVCSTPIDVVCNAANPSTVLQGGSTVLTATVTPGSNPTSTGIGVNVDLTNIGGGPTNAMLDDGIPPDAAIDGTYTLQATVNIATTPGAKSLLVTATDAQSRSDTCNISLTVTLPPPANDACTGAVAIACGGSATTDNSGATTDANDPSYACRIGGAGQGAGSVWFSFVATQTSARVNTETSVVTDTLLHVFSGTCGSLTVIGCDDDGGSGLLSQADVSGLTVGDTYYIEAACWSTSTTRGNITVNVICPVPPPPPGDTCADAVVIASLPFSDTKDNSALTADGPPGSCNSGSATTMQNSMWYVWTAQRDGSHTLTVDPNGYDGIAAVLTGACPSPATEIGCGDEPEPIVITWTASRCTTYYMQIGDWGVSPGGGSTGVSLTGPTPCPGDVDGDGDVDQDDLDLVLFNFGSGSAAPGDGDLDCDGDVDQDDLDIVLFNFATTCP